MLVCFASRVIHSEGILLKIPQLHGILPGQTPTGTVIKRTVMEDAEGILRFNLKLSDFRNCWSALKIRQTDELWWNASIHMRLKILAETVSMGASWNCREQKMRKSESICFATVTHSHPFPKIQVLFAGTLCIEKLTFNNKAQESWFFCSSMWPNCHVQLQSQYIDFLYTKSS